MVCTILHRIFLTVAAVSMLLLLATLGLWPWSYYQGAFLMYYTPSPERFYSLGSWGGRAELTYNIQWNFKPAGFAFQSFTTEDSLPWINPTTNLAENWGLLESKSVPFGFQFLGVTWTHRQAGPAMQQNTLDIPFAYFTLIFVVLPGIVGIRAMRRRRRAQRVGLCPECGYDVRALRGELVAGGIRHA